MKKLLIVIILFVSLPISSFSQIRSFKERDLNGYNDWIVKSTDQSIILRDVIPFSYHLNDCDDRNLFIEFIDAGIISLSNLISHRNDILFIDYYKVHFEKGNKVLMIDSLIYSNRREHIECALVPPFDRETQFNYCNSVFPILPKATEIRISKTYQDIAINDFFFHIQAFTDEDDWEYKIMLMKNHKGH